MYSVHVNMMTLFISKPIRAVRHLANTQDKVQNVVPESEECQRPLFLSVQSYRQCTYSMFVVLIKNGFLYYFIVCHLRNQENRSQHLGLGNRHIVHQ